MRVIPVIDLMGGAVVRGIAGRRNEYRPIVSCIAPSARPADVAAAFAGEFGFQTVYVADLDAIVHDQPDAASWQQIAHSIPELILDAGIGSRAAVDRIFSELNRLAVSARLVIGLESLDSLADLHGASARAQRPIFSLDLKEGRPQARTAELGNRAPLELIASAIESGVGELIVLDLADVGVSRGTQTLGLCREIRRQFPDLKVIAGGGVRGADDLLALADAGCHAALVASALHNGRLGPDDLRGYVA